MSAAKIGWRFAAGLSALFLLGLIALISVMYLGTKNVGLYKDLGPWGDFTAGVLNPALTFLTFTGVLLTIVLQRVELALTRDEMTRSSNALEKQNAALDAQRFETTFFEMMKLHNEIVNAIDLVNAETGVTTRGRDCLGVLYTRFTKLYRETKRNGKGKYDEASILRLAYKLFWDQAQTELGHYYRFLYNFFRLIDSSAHAASYHGKLLRSQLSNQELLLLFYNCTSEHGRKFKDIASKHALFDNMPTVRLLDKSHAELVGEAAFGSNPMQTSRDMRVPGTRVGSHR